MWRRLFLLVFMVAGSTCFVNLVNEQRLHGNASMAVPPQTVEWSADKAIDNNTNQDYMSNSCTITDIADGYRQVWWKVWLERRFNIAYLEIYFRDDVFERSAGFSIYTYDTENFYPLRDPKHLVYRHDPMSGCPSPIQNVTVNNVTQGIVFINERPPGYTSNCSGDNNNHIGIEICEIKVMGCDQRMYASDCNRFCPNKCKNQHCDVYNGSCIYGCANPNALTLDCIVCPYGKFIVNDRCVPCQGYCKNNTPCNKLTGRCDEGCQNNWTGDFCLECYPHFYGTDCTTQCGRCKDNDMCDNVTGKCPNGCQQHWQGDRCIECKDGFYKNNCSGICGQCAGDDVCNKITGKCPGSCKPYFRPPFCKECLVGFYGENCDKICPHCNKTSPGCQQSDGHCLHGCENYNWLLPKCDVLLSQLISWESEKKGDGISEITFSSVTATLAVVVLITIGIIIFQQRRISTLLLKRQQSHNIQMKRDTLPQNYDNLATIEETHQYNTLDASEQESDYQVISTS